MDEAAPDHSTLTRFKERLIRNRTTQQFEILLKEVVQMAIASGIEFGSVQILDSTHSVADVNTSKEETRKKGGKGPHDPDAIFFWGEHSRQVQDEQGNSLHQVEYFHGYKAHMSMNARNELITALTATSGGEFDGNQLPALLQQDEESGMEYDTVTADRAYDDGNHHYLLQQKGLLSAIHLKSYRIKKKDANKKVRMVCNPPHNTSKA